MLTGTILAGLEKRVGASVMWGLSWFEGGHLWAIKIQPGEQQWHVTEPGI